MTLLLCLLLATPAQAQDDGALPDSVLPDGVLPDGVLLDGVLPDSALLDGLLQLLSDESPALGADALGLLEDPRAVWVLTHSVTHRAPDVAAAAARALGHFPQAEGSLLGWVRTPTLTDGVRLAAAQALTEQRSTRAADTLVAAMGDRGTSPTLRTDLRGLIAAHWPERLAQADAQVADDGTLMLMGGSAAGMGYALAATGHFGQSGLEALGAVTGAAGGATLGFVWARTRPVENAPATFFAVNGLTGLTGGTLLGVWADSSDDHGPWIGGLLGGVAGYGVGLGGWSAYQGTPGHALTAGVVGLTSGGLMASSTAFAQDNGASLHSDTVGGMFGVGLLAGTTAGHLTVQRRDWDDGDGAMLAGASIFGTFLGAATPLGSLQRSALPAATGTGGALVAYALVPVVDVPLDVTGGALAGATYGGFIGGGVGMLIDPDSSTEIVEGAVTAGGTAGLLLGGLLAQATPGGLQSNDAVLTGLTTGWAAWQTVGWAAITDPDPDMAGILVLAPATVGAATAVASPWLDVQLGDSLAATSLGLWGAYLGATVGTLADVNSDTNLGLALAVSDVGLLGGAVLMSPLVDASPVVVGVADAGGVLGGATGALVTALFTSDSDPILIASLVGAGAGATGGALLGGQLERRNPQARLPRLPRLPPGVAISPAWLPADEGGVPGLRLDIADL